MSTTPRGPTGRREERDGVTTLVLEREFDATVEEVWAAVSEPERMQRWIGTWSGDPASGEVLFAMTAEGEDVAAERQLIEVCKPPHRYVVRSPEPQPSRPDGTGDMVWRLGVEITATPRGARLRLTQDLYVDDVAWSVGPGWEYYADRLVAVLRRDQASSVAWDDYYPAQCDYYRGVFG